MFSILWFYPLYYILYHIRNQFNSEILFIDVVYRFEILTSTF